MVDGGAVDSVSQGILYAFRHVGLAQSRANIPEVGRLAEFDRRSLRRELAAYDDCAIFCRKQALPTDNSGK
jgi:hypothetical protein